MAQAKATLLAHTGTSVVTLDHLKTIEVPPATDTWTPVPHITIPQGITEMVQSRGWSFIDPENNRFQVAVTKDGDKMFGVTKITIPDILDAEAQLAIGFRNSHDKSMAVRIAVGASVTVCDNMLITGDINIRREHTSRISVMDVLERAFDQIPAAAQAMFGWLNDLKDRQLKAEAGVALLAEAVERKALPIGDFMDARSSFLASYEGANPIINHPGTVWSAYQAVTEQFKKHALSRTQEYTINLNTLVRERYN